MKRSVAFLLLLVVCLASRAEDGYRLWLRYDKIANPVLLQQYNATIKSFYFNETSAALDVAKKELLTGLQGLLGKKVVEVKGIKEGAILILTSQPAKDVNSPIEILKRMPGVKIEIDYEKLGNEGFIIESLKIENKPVTLITAKGHQGALYGVFHFLRLLQTHQSIQNLNITSVPKIQSRILNHWDNLNRYVERGYAGLSIWNWHTLPDYIDQRYVDYARANASIGINGAVLTNVNANALVLTKDYLMKVKALADVFRPYGIKVYLTARFSAPMEIGGLRTADPLNDTVRRWWQEKVKEIYSFIPDFGGFLVKANSEGQPGPQNYGRTHADGANMMADALAPYDGIVMWRAFVYDASTSKDLAASDRFEQAYNEFKPLDGTFRKNVMVQVKNGPIDFQPREPFSPLFGAMPQTPLAMEFQITQEYLGQATNLVYEAPMFKEVLDADTYQKGRGSQVNKVIDGSLHNYKLTCMAGVANIGNDRNWTGHPFGQANWYAFGRLAWDYGLSSAQIADEWIRQTFSNDKKLVSTARALMLSSHQTMVNYMTPLGLHHIMGTGNHYGPAPWVSNAGRADWNPVYYHRADSTGIGFDRTATGSNALAQYVPEMRKVFEDITTCPEDYLLWFHHVPWMQKMKSGRTLWDELCVRYQQGVDSVRGMQAQWKGLKAAVDEERFNQVQMLLGIQEKEAVWWRDACLLYFETFSKQPLPVGVEKPGQTLAYYKSLRFPFAPGN